MDLYEQLVLQQLCHNPINFVSWQYSIPAENGSEWSSPDFLVFQMGQPLRIYVVEVSSGAGLKKLARKVASKETQWFRPLRRHLGRQFKLHEDEYELGLKVFLRQDCAKTFFGHLIKAKPELSETDFNDFVEVIAFDAKPFPYQWEYDSVKRLNGASESRLGFKGGQVSLTSDNS